MTSGIDLSPYFSKYEQLMQGVDRIFEKMKGDYPQEVRCDDGCTDCCYALFDLSLVEALYLNHRFQELDTNSRNMILVEADKADRRTHKIKKQLFKAHEGGATEEEILKRAGKERVQCPLLVEGKCILYESRPLTCRLYGLPMKIKENTVSCSMSRFEPGVQYPTVDMQKLHEQLLHLSQELARGIGTRYADLHTVLVPVSMALLNEYGQEYLGVEPAENSCKTTSKDQQGPTREWVLGSGE
ncbi:YkgJ family cysteine cluster protein [Desulfonatronospira sp.]|uniref:YkgJ family cysteine cluster protein n=1 Tax=Desulfonatronospira sp. TaxID=1962951 RepID=UPI0025B976AB|nr:YkgJ family cysteine cluster protein [Desulfonatronospira sp.]